VLSASKGVEINGQKSAEAIVGGDTEGANNDAASRTDDPEANQEYLIG